MYSARSSALIVAALAAAGVAARAQSLQITVATTAVSMIGDTTRISLRVTNRPQSRDSIAQFFVEAPTGVLHVFQPTAGGDWTTGTQLISLPIANWSLLGADLAPGATTPPLTFEAVGLPGIVRIWGIPGFGPPDSVQDEVHDVVVPASPLAMLDSSGVVAWTVGVVPATSREPAALGKRLADLVGRSCQLGWIDDRVVCSNLASRAKAQAGVLDALLKSLAAQRGKHVSETAYQLLTFNAKFLLARL